MKLDVLIATYNRSDLLARALQSLLAAPVPAGCEVCVTVIDNNSTDATRAIVEECMPAFGGRLRYLFEKNQGKSWALNSGIAATDGDLIGMIDDDEEIDSHWFSCCFSAFAHPDVDFIGGATVANWSQPPPKWLPPDYPAVVGQLVVSSEVRQYGPAFDAVLAGGNAVIRRSFLDKLGPAPYATGLGRIGSGGMLTADTSFYQRLLEVGGTGFYLPDLIVKHYVQPKMLTKRYHRRWCFWEAVSLASQEKRTPARIPHLLGIPRWHFRASLAGLGRWAKGLVVPGAQPDVCFSGQLDFVRLLGFLYGRHIFRQ
jgi:glycosyltransferase involved in cell wall biosynthesis